ncbi:HAD family hydrolase [Agrobacterium sp. NPDC089420]|uniref:HAD family hydrolase n=1 Tax=Agrobacterium sp. NPDC089420 TaxID=3363918 RepID=UPI0038517794
MNTSISPDRYIVWDFEGTLAVRRGRYTGALETAAGMADPAFLGMADTIRPFLSGTFPWHRAELAHSFAGDAEGWWCAILTAAEGALVALGMDRSTAAEVATRSREIYLDPAGWEVDPQAMPALVQLSAAGWRHVILSNFAPELPALVNKIGLCDCVDHVFSSGLIGLEKPSAALFRHVARVLAPHRACWMIGDNPHADIAGGRAAGLSTILLRPDSPKHGLSVPCLSAIPPLILEENRP